MFALLQGNAVGGVCLRHFLSVRVPVFEFHITFVLDFRKK